jgi:glutamate dehydrogenase
VSDVGPASEEYRGAVHVTNGPGAAFLSDVIDRSRSRVPDRLADHLPVFAGAYTRHVTVVAEQPPDAAELAAEIAGALHFADERRTDIAVRVFTPDPSVDGYSAPGSVVETNTQDARFLIESLTAAIHAAGITVANVVHPVLGIQRDQNGAITAVIPARECKTLESVTHFELEQRLEATAASDLEASLRKVLRDVLRAVRDFDAMQARVGAMIEIAAGAGAAYPLEDIEEVAAFLRWLLDNFVFLGYREYNIVDVDGEPALVADASSGLGILDDTTASTYAQPVPLASLPNDLRRRHEGGKLVVITKTNAVATVHRRAKMDYIGLRKVDRKGNVIGEARLLGLFTSKAYMAPASRTPLLARKLERILSAEDVVEGSHDHRAITRLFDSFPKDELFAAPFDELRREIVGLLELQESEQVKLFIKPDLLGRSVSILVAMPRDRFNAALRKSLQHVFLERFHGRSVDYRLSLGEYGPARIHFTVWTGKEVPEVSFRELEEEVVDLARTWSDRIAAILAARFGENEGAALARRWADRFPDYYKDSTAPEVVAGDIAALDRLAAGDGELLVSLQQEPGDSGPLTRLAVYRICGKLDLSELMPVLEDLGLRIVEEVPTRLLGDDRQTVIHDFGVLDETGSQLDLGVCGDRIAAAITAALDGSAETDSLHRLIVTGGLNHRQLEVLRAYRNYWRRVGTGFSLGYLNDTLAEHPSIAADLVRFFEARFDPGADPAAEDQLRETIVAKLDDVESLDHDRILRGFLELMTATVRTNAFRPDRQSLSFKFRSVAVPEMPRPFPRFEIFVHSPIVEGIHLRGGMISRGGIRWSTRREDYRTEVLGLMKAQMTKNAIIVPTGAKGGFVLRRPPADPAETRTAVAAAYDVFIRSLLDVTDNLVSGRVIRPDRVRVHDGDDPYLVVAADKGTATFSDTANAIAAEYGFWLRDAFASGGSAGYDHKELGITARGAWESVKWHFRECGTDIMTEPVTVAGIGDMSGDVFGNGMLLSPALKLVAAFDHRHIFIDPDPDPSISFAERRRLFELPRSSWADYDTGLLSPGGGIYPRTAKRISIPPEAQRALGTDRDSFTPDELIQTILLAPLDLLWNGGIGTYVKATHESHDAAGDRTNDAIRVNGKQLRFKVVGEGGNLGFTQPGRIEFARNKGRIFTDFIDNSGGVNCSDREVNLKILLGLAEERGEIDRTERDQIVASVADEVVERILYDSFLQAQILSQEEAASADRLEAYEDLIEALEDEGELDRDIEHLPTTDEMVERARDRVGMTAPELATLLTYAKRDLRRALLNSPLPEWPHFAPDLFAYFPDLVTGQFGRLVLEHPLRRELLATIVANQVVNSEGITFVSRLTADTGAGPADIVRAYRIAREVTGAGRRWREIEHLVTEIDSEVTNRLITEVDNLVEAVTRWYLAHPTYEPVADAISAVRSGFDELEEMLPRIGPPEWQEARAAEIDALATAGVPSPLARRHAYQNELEHAPDIIQIAAATNRTLRDVARMFFLLGPVFRIDWLESAVAALPKSGRWHRRAIETVQDDLVRLRRDLAERVLGFAPGIDPPEAIDSFLTARSKAYDRLLVSLRRLAQDGIDDVAPVLVAIRQISSFLS